MENFHAGLTGNWLADRCDPLLFSGGLVHRADQFQEGVGRHFLVAGHRVFAAVVLCDAHGELQPVRLTGLRGQCAGQVEEISGCNQFLHSCGDRAGQGRSIDRDRRREKAGDTAASAESNTHGDSVTRGRPVVS